MRDINGLPVFKRLRTDTSSVGGTIEGITNVDNNIKIDATEIKLSGVVTTTADLTCNGKVVTSRLEGANLLVASDLLVLLSMDTIQINGPNLLINTDNFASTTSFQPMLTDAYNIGSQLNRWNCGYFSELIVNGKALNQLIIDLENLTSTISANNNKELFDLRGVNESDFLSQINGNSVGITNDLFRGEYITCTSETAMSAGRVVSFTSVSGSSTADYQVTFCNGLVGEQGGSSQAIGVTMNDVLANGTVRVAVKGICSVLIGISSVALRGCMVNVGGSALTYQGRVSLSSRVSNQPSIGICMSTGNKTVNQPILLLLQSGFESY